ncbi:MAG: indole-3-glycerol phosphate synthase TrpC [Thermodesulfobacteriota bacterium]|nr:indole-3-glycerol phosphate synthase TrpC [Thermodesulfobacteriota bacterium]
MNILDKIVENKRDEVKSKMKTIPLDIFKKKIDNLPPPLDFKRAITKKEINIIAEIKKASPSKGVLRQEFDPVEIAKIYEENGAQAISVLTDEKFFQGKLDHMIQVKENISIPVLRKDFILYPYQVYESRASLADAILLIARILDDDTLEELYRLARNLSLQCLFEVHTEDELFRVLDIEPEVIGINNRDLDTFTTNISTTISLLENISSHVTTVSESGIHNAKDLARLKVAGVGAFLIGEALIKEDDIGSKLKELVYAQ